PIDVSVNPLAGNRLGQPIVSGRTGVMSVEEELPIGRALTAVMTPRLALYTDDTRDSKTAGGIDQLYMRGLFRNVAVTVGRDYVFFGQGLTAGITNSLNPGGFDMVRVSSESPFVLPSVFRLLGPLSATAFVADLGRDQLFPHTHLINYKLSARPIN